MIILTHNSDGFTFVYCLERPTSKYLSQIIKLADIKTRKLLLETLSGKS